LANHHTEPGTSRRELAPDPLNSIMEQLMSLRILNQELASLRDPGIRDR